MDREDAQTWVSKKSRVVAGFYITCADADVDEPENSYCIDHAAKVAMKLSRETKRDYRYAGAWAGTDTVERCVYKDCEVTLNCGGLTDHGVKWALGCDEENPLSFVADVHELELVSSTMVHDNPLWPLWLSQVLRLQPGVTEKHCQAFEAAWLAGRRDLALDLLRERPSRRKYNPRRRRAA